MIGSWSDHGRIGRALEMTFHPFSANFFEILDGHFSWQAQYSVKFGMIAGARNVVFFNTKCSWWA